MKLKINKACDLNSISVLPPHSRRSSMMQQPRSQPSQQSFSQGFSSQQNGIFSQISQNSVDEVLTDNQRFSSQEKDHSVRRLSCLAPTAYPREESQMPLSRNSSSLTRRWNSTTVPEHKCQLSDELEHKISMMDTSLNRLGMILDSVQADIMQVNKGTKELSLEVEGIRQKSIAHHDSLHLLNRTQEEMKTSLESISNQLLTIMQKDKNQEVMMAVSNLQEKIDLNYQKQSDELSKCLSRDLQEIMSSLKTLHQKNAPFSILPPKMSGVSSSSQKPILTREAEPLKVFKPSHLAPKIEMGRWTAVKPEQTAQSNRYGNSCNNPKQRSSMDREQKIIIDLDDETDGAFSCLIVEKESDRHFMVGLEEDTARILREARRRKRKRDSKKLFATRRK
ncbi:protein PAIR1 [Chenopodium quinoa]|uniref:protein PAIR1 n=1 Tax=Chenopodium quinoa TaxID=63459 RepID=UPI000B77E38B|nr:protein PAIR1 [Chenopodium quinoa]XP_021748610.1 protein PAIR1 [Chenopodium quinoa]